MTAFAARSSTKNRCGVSNRICRRETRSICRQSRGAAQRLGTGSKVPAICILLEKGVLQRRHNLLSCRPEGGGKDGRFWKIALKSVGFSAIFSYLISLSEKRREFPVTHEIEQGFRHLFSPVTKCKRALADFVYRKTRQKKRACSFRKTQMPLSFWKIRRSSGIRYTAPRSIRRSCFSSACGSSARKCRRIRSPDSAGFRAYAERTVCSPSSASGVVYFATPQP